MRAVALVLASLSVVAIRPTYASPGDIFTTTAPVIGSPAPAATPIPDGDASVATQTGALQYSYPISVPPGRNGIQPHLALSYSSQAPIYGTLAAGWTLTGLPIITEDTRQGGLWKAANGKRYQSSMAGDRVLVQVTEPTPAGTTAFRAQNDSTYTRYQLFGGDQPQWWKALAPDGTVYLFGQTDALHRGSCSFSDSYAPLTQVADSFGNIVDYEYTSAFGECVISKIEWGANSTTGSNLSHFARIVFNYDITGVGRDPACSSNVWPGSQTSYRTGSKIVAGAAKLGTITITAYPPGNPGTPDHTRVITLAYNTSTDESCSAAHAPFRSLASIQESAWGTDSPRVDLPAVTFTYGNDNWGSGTLAYSAESAQSLPWASAAVIGNDVHNLGWGYRFTGGAWPTVEAMMIDIDGDGLVDRVIDGSLDTSDGHVHACYAHWFRNQPTGGFADMGLIPLPTLKWAGTGPTWGKQPDGVTPAYAREDLNAGANERCALNYQWTDYVNSSRPEGSIVCPGLGTCPGSDPNDPNYPNPAYCNLQGQLDYGTDCTGKNSSGTFETILAYRWIDFDDDGKVDLVASIARGGYYDYNLDQGDLPGATQEPALFQPPGATTRWPDCPVSSYTAFHGNPFPSDPGKPYTRCGGMFAWFVYKNKGNGVFGNPQSGAPPLPDQIVYQPIPLETSTGDSSITNNPVGQDQGLLDIDGDGRSDAVVGPEANGSWQVFRNAADGTGSLIPVTGSSSFPFTVRSTPAVDLNNTDIDTQSCLSGGNCNPVAMQGLTDINGDGLLDQWTSSDGSNSNVSMNEGTAFELNAQGSGDVDLTLRPGNDGSASGTSTLNSNFVTSGQRFDTRRLFDTDLDGRVDVLENNSTRFNEGMGFGSAVGTLGDGLALQHRIVATENQLEDYMSSSAGTLTPYAWELRSDEIDLDGDGIPEGVDFGTLPQSVEMDVSRVTTPTQPPRLLVGINNNRGAVTSIAYAPLSNTSVVTQEPDQGKASPRTQWVVSSVTVTDSFATAPASTSTYTYKDPKWSADDEGRYGFRGFEEVTTTGPSGAKTVERYSFSPDWSGRLVETLLIAGEDGSVNSISTTSWEAFPLFTGALTTYHATVQEHYTCDLAQAEADCLTFPAGYTRTTSTFKEQVATAPGSGVTPLLYVETASLLSASPTDSDGDRQTYRDFVLFADESTYRLRQVSATKSERSGGVFNEYAKSAQTWDGTCRLKLTDEEWLDSNDSDRAITSYDYDSITGNTTARQKPDLYPSGPKTTYGYDTRAVFPTTETDELGHVTTYAYEPGTGTKLSTIGPNVADCAATSSCPVGTPDHEEHVIRVDGLGREIGRYETFSYDGSTYSYVQTGITQYTEAALNGTPALPMSITTQHVLDASVGTYDKVETDFDGHGRPFKKTVFTSGSAPADAVTTFTYGSDGTLQAVSVPDPSHNDASTVTYTYGFDSLGRPISVRRPDGATPSEQSGVNIFYQGLLKITSEVIPANDTPVGGNITTTDSFGRLTQVSEPLPTPGTFAVTQYQYDANDNVKEVDAPEGVTTLIAHDFAGRRTSITRGARTWKYGYDGDGNMVSEQVPGSTDPSTDIDYTTSIVYDVLDRPISKTPGQRTLSGPDQALFGTGTEEFVWDVGANHIGRLRYWRSFAPGANTPTIERDLGVNAQGLSTATTENINVDVYLGMSRTFAQDYFENGVPKSFTYNDEFSGTDATTATVGIDPRGLPSSVSVAGLGCRQSGFTRTTISMTRNVAGLVTSRTTDNPGATWTYDALGRITNQTVSSSAQIVRQGLTYFGNDDPSSLDHYLGTSQKHFNFTYDARHQLLGAHETTSPGYFDATYAFGDGGRFTHATESTTGAPGSEVTPRDVSYEYAGDDPEEVTALRNASDNSVFAAYTYDEAGNQTSRSYSATGEGWDYTYDGKDQLRRVVHKLADVVQSSEEYWYDENGSRVLTLKRDAAGNQTELVWWIGDAEAHYNGPGSILKTDSYVTVGTALFRITRNRACSNGVVMPFVYLFHGLGDNTIAAVDQFGNTTSAMSYAPFGEVLETVNDASGERRRMNDKFVDEVSGLAYYGARFYDKTSMTWTQGDPFYRYVPDAAWTEPRRANLYAANLQNTLRYSDPDGRDVVQMNASDAAHVSETTAAMNTILGAFGTVTSENVSIEGNNVAIFSVQQTAAQKNALWSSNDVAAQDLVTAINDNLGLVMITMGDAESDPALKVAGGAGTGENWVSSTGQFVMPVTIDYKYATSQQVDAKGVGKTNETDDTVLGHEILAHQVNRLDEDTPAGHSARDYENKYLRSKHPGMQQRKVPCGVRCKHNGINEAAERHFAPADADRNGTVSDEEESAWMRSVQ